MSNILILVIFAGMSLDHDDTAMPHKVAWWEWVTPIAIVAFTIWRSVRRKY